MTPPQTRSIVWFIYSSGLVPTSCATAATTSENRPPHWPRRGVKSASQPVRAATSPIITPSVSTLVLPSVDPEVCMAPFCPSRPLGPMPTPSARELWPFSVRFEPRSLGFISPSESPSVERPAVCQLEFLNSYRASSSIAQVYIHLLSARGCSSLTGACSSTRAITGWVGIVWSR
eukprot:COSAG02_NODE_513_length_20826_cov_323.015246_20_plen_175_part_00